MEYLELEEDYEDKENIKILKHFLDVYFDEKSDEEVNISSKTKNNLMDKVMQSNQLSEHLKWKIGETLKKLFFPAHKNLRMDLASDSFNRFIASDLWKKNMKKFLKNPEVMEKVEIYDIKESKDKRWSRKISKEEEEEEKERKEELSKKYLSEGLELFKLKKWEEAYDSFTMAITYNEHLKEAYFNRGVLSYNSQKHVDAVADMSFVIENDSTNARALSVRGMSLKKLGKYDLAAKDFKNSVKYEEIFNNFMLLGICYDKLEMEEEAIEAYTNYITKAKIKENDPGKILFQENMMSVFHNRAQAYFSLNQYENAINDYSKSIGLCDNDDFIREMKGKRSKCYQALGFDEEAKRDYIESMENSVNAIYNEGIDLFYKKKYFDALHTMNAAIEIKNDDFNFYYVRGVCYKYLGEIENAIQDFETSFKLNPDYTKAVFPLLKMYEKLNKLKSVLRCFSILLEKCPTAELYLDRATILGEIEGKEQESINDFTNAIKLNPDLIDAYYNRATIYKQLDEFENAIPDYDKCLSVENPDSDLYVDRGMCYYQLDNMEKAENDFRKALEVDPENERALSLIDQIENGDEEDDDEE